MKIGLECVHQQRTIGGRKWKRGLSFVRADIDPDAPIPARPRPASIRFTQRTPVNLA
jgi:hypothetical protein